jgi:hypothetical protein
MRLCAAILLALVTAPAQAADVEALVLYEHRSNAFRGGNEPTEDMVCGGATITWRSFELDVCHGYIARDCDANARCRAEPGTKIATRWYPGRTRRALR